ncbi:MAG: hypothetical protein ACRELD_06350 [Longimicrobiales bacterium]
MTDQPLYTAHAEIRKIQATHRRARLSTGHEIDFGVHGAIKRYYHLDAEPDLPLPVDYLVAAAGG